VTFHERYSDNKFKNACQVVSD